MKKGIIISLLIFISPTVQAAEDEYTFVVREGDSARSLTERYLVRPTAWERVVQYNYILKPGNLIKVPARLVAKDGMAFIKIAYGEAVVKVKGEREWRPAVDGLILGEGDAMKTGPASGMVVVMGEGGTAILGNETEVMYEPYSRLFAGRVNRLNILRGEVEALIPPAADREAGYEIVTLDTQMLLKGTRLRTKVGDGGGTRLEVLEGEVTVDSSGEKFVVEEGMGAVLGNLK